MPQCEKFTREEQKYNLLTAVFFKLFKYYSSPVSFLWASHTIPYWGLKIQGYDEHLHTNE